MSRRFRGSLALALLGLSLATVAGAAGYQGWGDTGWNYYSRRDCCDGAIAIAQQYSSDACLDSGGVPRPPFNGGQRGSCTVQWMQTDDGGMLYRCSGEATLWCR